MNTKVITFHDIANNYISMKYGGLGVGKKGYRLLVISKFGNYLRVWNSDDEIVKTEFKALPGYVFRDDSDDNRVISCFKKTVKRMLGQDPKLQELYLLAKPTIKKCYKDHDKKGLGEILMWLISNQK